VPQPAVVAPRYAPCCRPDDRAALTTRGMTVRQSWHPQGSGQSSVRVGGKETVCRAVVDERVVSQPLHGTAAGPGIPEGVPGRQQARMFFVEFVFEPAEGSLALDSPCQPAPGALIGDSVGEVGHVLIPDPGRQRLDDDQVQFIEVDWRLPVYTGVSRPERDLSRVRVDQPVVFVIGLVGQRVGDLLKIEAAQVKHQARIDLPRYLRSGTGTPDQRHDSVLPKGTDLDEGISTSAVRVAYARGQGAQRSGGRAAPGVR
jgi:hypothetical protein